MGRADHSSFLQRYRMIPLRKRAMRAKSLKREKGVALFLALIALLGGLALSSAMVCVALADSRSHRQNEDHAKAFYLAESGLQGAHYELAEHQDSGKDGEGT